MKKFFFSLAWLAMMVLSVQAQDIYDFTVRDADGKDVSLSTYRGKVLLVVNTATKCGFTPQYKELEALYEKYRERGFEILDFPCNQFGQQAPGSITEIHQFCTANFNIQFPQFGKIDVNGPQASPLFVWLKRKAPFRGFGNSSNGQFMHQMLLKKDPEYAKSPDIKWNFTKFLINRRGKVVARFEPTASIEEIEKALQKLL